MSSRAAPKRQTRRERKAAVASFLTDVESRQGEEVYDGKTPLKPGQSVRPAREITVRPEELSDTELRRMVALVGQTAPAGATRDELLALFKAAARR